MRMKRDKLKNMEKPWELSFPEGSTNLLWTKFYYGTGSFGENEIKCEDCKECPSINDFYTKYQIFNDF